MDPYQTICQKLFTKKGWEQHEEDCIKASVGENYSYVRICLEVIHVSNMHIQGSMLASTCVLFPTSITPTALSSGWYPLSNNLSVPVAPGLRYVPVAPSSKRLKSLA